MAYLNRILLLGVAALALAGTSARAAETINAEILNFSEMNRWVRVTDLVCGTELYKDTMEAQQRLPVALCAGEDGTAKVELYVRIGCSKNKTYLKEQIAEGATVAF